LNQGVLIVFEGWFRESVCAAVPGVEVCSTLKDGGVTRSDNQYQSEKGVQSGGG
jgi:hypothetical protein